ncbi:hypothetical protein L1887_47348 [Cichorium endivia]|nr:hypothetical protein L1887_47348 [Cichorium endivia]
MIRRLLPRPGNAWRVTGREGEIRTLRCDETGQEISISIGRAITDFALVPNHLPEAYFPDLDLTPAQLEGKYAQRGNDHPFLTKLPVASSSAQTTRPSLDTGSGFWLNCWPCTDARSPKAPHKYRASH